jgi:hypothetical protein
MLCTHTLCIRSESGMRFKEMEGFWKPPWQYQSYSYQYSRNTVDGIIETTTQNDTVYATTQPLEGGFYSELLGVIKFSTVCFVLWCLSSHFHIQKAVVLMVQTESSFNCLNLGGSNVMGVFKNPSISPSLILLSWGHYDVWVPSIIIGWFSYIKGDQSTFPF